MRYLLATLEDHNRWLTVLPRLSATLSNSTSRGTGLAATQVMYSRRIKEGSDLARTEENAPAPPQPQRAGSAPPAIAVNAYPTVPDEQEPYWPTHVDAKDAIALATMVMKRQHDAKYLQKFFSVGDWASLRLHRGYTVPGLQDRNHKIEQQFAGPFEVIKKINPLAYRLRLPNSMSRLHSVISIAHLEPAKAPHEDPYTRHPTEPILTPANEVNRPIERLLLRRDQRRRAGGVFTEYLVRYEGLGVEYGHWRPGRGISEQLKADFEAAKARANQEAPA